MKKSERNDKYGINMEKWCRDHEAAVVAALEGSDHFRSSSGVSTDSDADCGGTENTDSTGYARLLALHEKKLAWLQHERLVHLIVLVMTVFGELFTIGVAVFTEANILAWVIMYLILIVLVFYIRHYFVLENTVQRWYVLAEKLSERAEGGIKGKTE